MNEIDVLRYKNEMLMRAIEVHASYLEHQCNCYNDSNKEKIAVRKIMPPIKRLIYVLQEMREMDKLDKTSED